MGLRRGRPNHANLKYKKIAAALEQEIRSGNIPDGSALTTSVIEERFGIGNVTVTNVFSILRSNDLIELRRIEGNKLAIGIRGYFVKSPENPGGSSERR